MENNSGEAGKCRRNHCKNGNYLQVLGCLIKAHCGICNLTVKIRGPVIFTIAIFAQICKYNIALLMFCIRRWKSDMVCSHLSYLKALWLQISTILQNKTAVMTQYVKWHNLYQCKHWYESWDLTLTSVSTMWSYTSTVPIIYKTAEAILRWVEQQICDGLSKPWSSCCWLQHAHDTQPQLSFSVSNGVCVCVYKHVYTHTHTHFATFFLWSLCLLTVNSVTILLLLILYNAVSL